MEPKPSGNVPQDPTPSTSGHDLPATQLGLNFNPAMLLDPRRGVARASANLKKAQPQQSEHQNSSKPTAAKQPLFTFSNTDSAGNESEGEALQGSMIESMHRVEQRADHPNKRVKRSVSPTASVTSHVRSSQASRYRGGIVAQHLKDHRARIAEDHETTPTIDLTEPQPTEGSMMDVDTVDNMQVLNKNTDSIDLTAEVPDRENNFYTINGKKVFYDPQDSEEREVCFGRIEGTRIQAFKVPDPKRPISTRAEWPSIKIDLTREFGNAAGRIKAMDPTGTWFGNMDMKTSYALKSLIGSSIYRLRLDARLDVRSKDNFEAPGQATSKIMSVTVNLYGPRKYAIDPVGKQLSQRQIWLRQPKWVPVNMDVFNPHCADPQLTRQAKKASMMLVKGMVASGVKTRTAEQEEQEITSLFENIQKTEELPFVQPDPNIKSELLPHQKQALGWMLEREKPRLYEDNKSTAGTMWRRDILPNGDRAYFNIVTGYQLKEPPQETLGGLLADMMGLGKTLQILSVISYTKTASEAFAETASPLIGNVRPKNIKTTLLVCPLSVIANWEDQIMSHVKHDTMTTYVYHGPGRRKDPTFLAEFDVVLTTYPTLKSEFFPSNRNAQAANSPLARVNFFRVVLDEAHYIRTAETQQCKAAMKLSATRRWCLTATPVQNRLEDLGSLIRFLKVSPFDIPGVFNQYICAPFRIGDPEAVKRLRVLVDTITLRRLKDKIDLVPRRDVIQYLSFSENEQALYDCFAADASKRIHAITSSAEAAKRKLAGRGYINILRSILCLRQISAHGKELLQDEDLKMMEGQNMAAAIDIEEEESRPILDPAQAYSMYDLLKETNQAVCARCTGLVLYSSTQNIDSEDDNPVIGTMLPCFQLVCNTCVKDVRRVTKQHQDAGEDRMLCPFCQTAWRIHLFEITVKGLAHNDDLKEELKNAPRKAKVHARYDGPHTKTTALINALMDSMNETLYLKKKDPKERPIKSVVFSAWTTHLDLISIALGNMGIPYTSLVGSMSRKARKEALREFAESDDVNVFLISIGTGGVGLNLTAASRVYLMDIGFNPMAEQQAVDRVHRLGQRREVVFTRYLMSGSIEEKILELQKKKMDLADLSLQRGRIDKTEASRRRLEDLKELFR